METSENQFDADSKGLEVVEAEVVQDSKVEPQWLTKLLSKQSLDLLMLVGGGLLVVGFAIWLWTLGVFENPLLLAGAIGFVNLGALATGGWLFLSSQQKAAGRAILLLASLVLPLNLWLYESQGLIPLESGHLWIPAMLITLFYAGITRATRDPFFVYTFVGGIVLTALLFLAGPIGGGLWSTLALSTCLVAIGSVGIQVDRAFLDDESDFSRSRFGKAFFNSGVICLVAGFGYLVSTHAMVLAAEFFGESISSQIAQPSGRWWAAGIYALSIYCFSWIGLSDRRSNGFTLLNVVGANALLILLIQIFEISLTLNTGLCLLAIVLLATNLIRWLVPTSKSVSDIHHVLACAAGVGIAAQVAIQYLIKYWTTAPIPVESLQWVQLALATLVVLTLPRLWIFDENDSISYSGLAGLALAMSLLTAMLSLSPWGLPFVFVALVPLAMSFIAYVSGHAKTADVISAISCSTLVFAFAGWGITVLASQNLTFDSLESLGFVALGATTCGIATLIANKAFSKIAMASFVFVLVAQLVARFDLMNGFVLTLIPTVIGLALVLVERLMRSDTANTSVKRIQQWGHGLVNVGSVGGILFVFAAIVAGHVSGWHFALLTSQLAAVGLASVFHSSPGWRQAYVVNGIANAFTLFVTLINLQVLTIGQQFEVAALILGAILLAVGLIGFFKENDQKEDFVTFSLTLGSLMVVLPLGFGLVVDRFSANPGFDGWRWFHEIGGLVAGLSLFSSGILIRLRSTTLSGAALLATYVISSLALIRFPEILQQTSVLMMIGGATFFAAAVAMSVYREKLLALPTKVQEGRGVFSVLKWR